MTEEFTTSQLIHLMRASGILSTEQLPDDLEESRFDDLGFDSLALLELIAKIEKQLDIGIPDDGLGRMTTPGAAVRYVNALLASPTTEPQP